MHIGLSSHQAAPFAILLPHHSGLKHGLHTAADGVSSRRSFFVEVCKPALRASLFLSNLSVPLMSCHD